MRLGEGRSLLAGNAAGVDGEAGRVAGQGEGVGVAVNGVGVVARRVQAGNGVAFCVLDLRPVVDPQAPITP